MQLELNFVLPALEGSPISSEDRRVQEVRIIGQVFQSFQSPRQLDHLRFGSPQLCRGCLLRSTLLSCCYDTGSLGWGWSNSASMASKLARSQPNRGDMAGIEGKAQSNAGAAEECGGAGDGY